jgi:hypothetical protein
MTATSASVQFATGGVVEVNSSLRLTGDSYVTCYTYDDQAPILGIDDAHVKVSITVPDTRQVTADDLTWARLLAKAVNQYLAELEKLAAANQSPAGPGAAPGRAA